MPSESPVFVLVHGSWNSQQSWKYVREALTERGYESFALDLPGSGANNTDPASYALPVDEAAFAKEISPNSEVTQQQRVDALVSFVSQVKASTGKPVILLGHSLHGVTVSGAAEHLGEELQAVVYLSAFLLPPGIAPIAALMNPLNAESKLSPLFVAPPPEIRAMRINFRSENPAYRAQLEAALGPGVPPERLAENLASRRCDEPVCTTMEPSPITRERFGALDRHFIRCLHDRSLPSPLQDYFIEQVDAAMPGKTIVHDLDSGHQGSLSHPGELADILVRIAQRQPVAV